VILKLILVSINLTISNAVAQIEIYPPFVSPFSEIANVSPAAPASENAAAIQHALLKAGNIQISRSGTYSIDQTLRIYSNTRFVLGPDVKIKLVGGALKPLIANSAYSMPVTDIGLSWSGSTSQVTGSWVSHGLRVGDYVWISNVSPSVYIGVFPVESVPDSNTFTFNTIRTPNSVPVAVSGSIHAVKADVNIQLEGGTWDADRNNNSGSGMNSMAIVLGGIAGLTTRNLTIVNAAKYCINAGALNGFHLEKTFVPTTGSDGIKVAGPAFNGSVDGLNGVFGDDVFSYDTKASVTYIDNAFTYGDIINCKARNIHGVGPVNLAVIYCSPNEFVDNVEFDGLSGSVAGYGAYIRTDPDHPAQGRVGTVIFRNIDVRSGFNVSADNTIADNVEIHNISANTFGNASAVMNFSSNFSVNNLLIDRLNSNLANWPSSTAYAIGVVGAVKNLRISNVSCYSAANLRFLDILGNVDRLTISDSYVSSGDTLVRIETSATNTPNISVLNSNLFQAAILSCSASCNALLAGNRITNAYNGILRTSGTLSHVITSIGNTNLGSTVNTVITSGTPSITYSGISGGTLLISGTAAAPSGTASPATWFNTTVSGTTYKVPLYQ